MTLPTFLRPLLGNSPWVAWVFYGTLGLLLLGFLILFWQIVGPGPRRRRGLRRARRRLQEGAWLDALTRVRNLRRKGRSASWIASLDQLEAECIQASTTKDLTEGRYEVALENALKAGQQLGISEIETRGGIQAQMLREIRRRFAQSSDTRSTRELISRTLQMQAPCREATFWAALCDIREGRLDLAQENLLTARGGVQDEVIGGSKPPDSDPSEERIRGLTPPNRLNPDDSTPSTTFIDPGLYLGILLLRQGQAKSALRFLTEANRLDSNCPLITLQLGCAMIEAGGDTTLAIRALQRALGPRGLAQWEQSPQKAWVESFTQGRSFIRKLAEEFNFTCPIWGSDLRLLIRQGNLALAQGQEKLGNLKESAELYEKVIKDRAPSLGVLRGLGITLAKLGRYDDAFKHLLTASEMEETKTRLTSGYLALCGACGTPSRPEDKLTNTSWAVRNVQQFNAPGDTEWVDLINRIFAQARLQSLSLSDNDQLYLCEHLLSTNSHDLRAGEAIHALMESHPSQVRIEYAWLFCQADQQQPILGDKSLDLYALCFSRPEAARAFFAERNWDFDAIEYRYLERAANQAPGQFPAALGPAYPPHGEQLLIQRCEAQEQAGQNAEALQTLEILVRLSPQNTKALDRTAELHYREGRFDRVRELLESWQQSHPQDPIPVTRLAVMFAEQNQIEASLTQIRRALSLCDGTRRAKIAFLGARLLIHAVVTPQVVDFTQDSSPLLAAAHDLLEEAIKCDPHQGEAAWCLAAIHWLQGDRAGVAALAAGMHRSEGDSHQLYFAALCELERGEAQQVLEACQRLPKPDPATFDLALEGQYLAGLAHLKLGQPEAAIEALHTVVQSTASPSRPQALALLGSIEFSLKNLDATLQAWSSIDVKQRQAWGLVEPLAQTMFARALEHLHVGQYEFAAEKFRHAGRLGCRDRRLGPLLLLALFKAGQRVIYGDSVTPITSQASTPEPSTPSETEGRP